MKLALCILSLSVTSMLPAASATAVYSLADFKAAQPSTIDYHGEQFTGGSIRSGLQIDDCSASVGPYAGSCGLSNGTVAPGSFTATIGGPGFGYTSTLYLLPDSTLSFGLDLSIPASLATQSPFTVSLLEDGVLEATSLPLYGTGYPFSSPSISYSGFIGLVSDIAFDEVAFSGLGGTYTATDLIWDPATETPEPVSLALFALGLLSICLYRRRSRYCTGDTRRVT